MKNVAKIYNYSIEDLNETLGKTKESKKRIICLEGPMGAGKTEFVKKFLFPIAVSSPTFTKLNIYPNNIWHFDLYSVENFEEIGLFEALEHHQTFIEWANLLPENIKKIYSDEMLIIEFIR